jgi:dipeptidyl aminopeptidase/acylaminoacyl peptidase
MNRRDLMALFVGAPFAVTGLDAAAQAGAELPIQAFFRKPSFLGAVLSPDRKLMAALSPVNERFNLVIYDIEKRTATRLTNLSGSDVNTVAWANDRRVIFTTGDQQGKEFRGDGGLFAINIDGSDPATLVKPFVTGSSVSRVPRITNIMRRIPDNSDEVLVSANDRSVDTWDVYRMNVQTGRKTLVNASSPGNVVNWVLDPANVPRAAYCMDFEKGRFWFAYLADPQGREWKTFAQWDEQLKDVIIPLAFDPTNPKLMFVASNVGRDTMALFDFDTTTGKLNELIHGDDRYDVFSFLLLGMPLGEGGRLIFGGTEDKPAALVGLVYQADKPKIVWFDEAAAKAHASMSASFPGNVTSFDVNSPRALVFTRSDTQPGEYFIYDRAKRAIEETGIRTLPDINPKVMRPMQPVSWTARDGLRIDGYLTLPATWERGKPVPMILHPHGGPWARDNWSFNPEVQFMANRGFAVLQPNFRGSTGYGARHLRLCYKQWGGTMIDGMIDGVEWAIKTGYADAGRIGVYGASYGGYATLMALVRRPELFKWGINYVGVTDMKVHQDTQPAQLYGNFADLAKRLNGDQKADAALFADQSPARHVERIKVPVFHAYGGEDRNVDFANGKTIRSAFDSASKPYEWMYVADEAHGYRQSSNVLDFYKRFDAFIKKHTPPAPRA